VRLSAPDGKRDDRALGVDNLLSGNPNFSVSFGKPFGIDALLTPYHGTGPQPFRLPEAARRAFSIARR